MRLIALAVISILSLILVACDWNPFHEMYSAWAAVQVGHGILINGQVIPTFSYHDGGLQPLDFLQSPAFLKPIIKEQKLDQIWGKRFKSDHDIMSTQDALDHLHHVLEVKFHPGTTLIVIRVYSELPQEAADIANAIADSDKAQSVRYAQDNQLEDDVRIIVRATPQN